jgi:alkylation response protein AidB-like acyl-CoA dehydrogenase
MNWLVGIAVLASVVFLFRPLRRMLFSDPALARFRAVLPDVSRTEQEALDAGTVWWDGELFRGRPDWQRLYAFPKPALTDAEQAFLDGPVDTLCDMLDDWEVSYELNDLPAHVWQFIRDEGFMGMIIPREFGGLGFSAFAHSEVIAKLATRSATATVTVMVPNSLGPAELLLHYGTDEQKQHYLPRLAQGLEIPCFALTGPDAGSDASSIPDIGIVCRDVHDGVDRLGIRLTWEKRYITLGPVATLLGLAFRLRDPDRLLGGEVDVGITLALIPTSHPGVVIGRRHFPLNGSFMNGPNSGRDVFIPIDWIVGGAARAGQGWRMLMECLAAGRVDLAAVVVRRDGEARGAHDRRVRPDPHAVPDARRAVRGRRRGARPDRRQHLRDRGRARDDGRRRRPRREAVGDLRDREVPRDRTRSARHRRRHGHPRRQGHLPRAEQLPRPRVPAGARRDHGRGREHPDAQHDHLRARARCAAIRSCCARWRRRATPTPHAVRWRSTSRCGATSAMCRATSSPRCSTDSPAAGSPTRRPAIRWRTTSANCRASPRRSRSRPMSRCSSSAVRSSAARSSRPASATSSRSSTSRRAC